MDIERLEGHLAAMEVMLFAIAQQLDLKEFLADLAEQRSLAVTSLSNTVVSDERIAALEHRLDQYLTALGLG